MGTKMKSLPVTRVSDGDTLWVEINGEAEKLRLICVDTEESYATSGKPVTPAGKAASKMAKEYFRNPDNSYATVDIEFDTDDPVEVCLKKHRGNYGRLICYVFKEGDNYNLRLVKEGWSPYFAKYGRSRQYHEEFTRAEAEAQAHMRVIWEAMSRDYTSLIPWWEQRAAVVDSYRREGIAAGYLSVRLDYEKLTNLATNDKKIKVLADLQGGLTKFRRGAKVTAGSKHHKFNLWIPDHESDMGLAITQLILLRYAEKGRGYVYITGKGSLYNDTPQVILTDKSQLSDFPQ